jgi:hypothetical protein
MGCPGMSIHACIVLLISQNFTLICGSLLVPCQSLVPSCRWIKMIETRISLLCRQPCTHVLEWRMSLGSLQVCKSSMSSEWLSMKIARVQRDRSFRRNINKRPLKLMRERKFARERLFLLPPLLCILMWRVSPPAVVWHQLRAVSMWQHHWWWHQTNKDDLQVAVLAATALVALDKVVLVMLAVAAMQSVVPLVVVLLLLQAISLQCRWVAMSHCL